MRRFVLWGWSGAWLVGVVLSVGCGTSRAATKVAAEIVSPPANSIVGRVTEIAFEISVPGVPLVLVAAEDETVEWWVQPTPKSTAPGHYTVAAHFGNAKTPQGKSFRAMVMMVADERAAQVLAKQQVIKELPKEFVLSKPVRLLRRFEAEAVVERTLRSSKVVVPGVAQIVGIENRAQVARRHEIRGRVAGPLDPVVLVRSTNPTELWWVQDHVRRSSNGEFSATVRFGDDKTPAGSEFQMIALTPASIAEAERYKVGDSLAELPKDAIVSIPMTFVLKEREAGRAN